MWQWHSVHCTRNRKKNIKLRTTTEALFKSILFNLLHLSFIVFDKWLNIVSLIVLLVTLNISNVWIYIKIPHSLVIIYVLQISFHETFSIMHCQVLYMSIQIAHNVIHSANISFVVNYHLSFSLEAVYHSTLE